MARTRLGKLLRFACLASIATALGCPEPKGATVQAHCSKAYEQCVLSSGVLGVCNPVECSANQTEPCLVCRSQH
jgi:hypothetical protein